MDRQKVRSVFLPLPLGEGTSDTNFRLFAGPSFLCIYFDHRLSGAHTAMVSIYRSFMRTYFIVRSTLPKRSRTFEGAQPARTVDVKNAPIVSCS